MRKNNKVCFIAGAGHSGSTVVGMVLGSHRSVFYAGEAGKTRYIHNPKKDLRKRVCKICGPGCKIWSRFPAHLDGDIYEEISRLSGRPVVVDSTKNVDWIKAGLAQIEGTEAKPHMIFLQRDGRAVINSRLRKYPEKDLGEMISAWATQMERTEQLFSAFAYPKARLQYEDFATDPDGAIRTLCELLGVMYEPDMIDFFRHEHHPLGGNNGTQHMVARVQGPNVDRPYAKLSSRNEAYYTNHELGIKLDQRWQEELPKEAERQLEDLAGHVNASYRWKGH